MIKILHCVNSMGLGGIENFVMNVYRKLDKEQFSFDFAYADSRDSFFDNEIKELGGNIYYMPPFRYYNPLYVYKDYKARKTFFKEHSNYDVCHIHASNAFSAYIRAKAALDAKIKKVIVHSHTSAGFFQPLNDIFRYKLGKLNIIELACSDAAGKWMYADDKFIVIRNGIQLDKYEYNAKKALQIRQKLQIDESEFVLGHVGRFAPVKNHAFLIKVFAKFMQENPKTKLLLVGDGPLKEDIKKTVTELGLNDSTIITGNVGNPYDYYNAMDAFVFPSHYEGLPLTLVEAQANGLPCLISDKIAPEVIMNDNVAALSITDDSVDDWCDRLAKTNGRTKCVNVKKFGYDALDVAKQIEAIWA